MKSSDVNDTRENGTTTSIPRPEATRPSAQSAASLLEIQTGRLIRLAELFERLGVSKATGHRLAAAGRIGPEKVRVGAGAIRYHLEEVLAWLANRKPDGTLYDARTWPSIWKSLAKK
jgi:predicted DNA-binding transcriptional regulator AlpA